MTSSDTALKNSNGSHNLGTGSPNRAAGSQDGGVGSGIRVIRLNLNNVTLLMYSSQKAGLQITNLTAERSRGRHLQQNETDLFNGGLTTAHMEYLHQGGP